MTIENIRAYDLRRFLSERRSEIEIIDVRRKEEFDIVHIKGSKLIPLEELPRRAGEIDWKKEVIFVCRSGKRSHLIASMADAAGAEVKNLTYGIFECYKDGKGPFLEASGEDLQKYF